MTTSLQLARCTLQWRHGWGHGGMDKTSRHGIKDTWRHGDMETLRNRDMRRHGHMDTWTWRNEIGNWKTEAWAIFLNPLSFAHRANDSLSLVCLLKKKQSYFPNRLNGLNGLAHLWPLVMCLVIVCINFHLPMKKHFSLKVFLMRELSSVFPVSSSVCHVIIASSL
jgi:hypothetical protein